MVFYLSVDLLSPLLGIHSSHIIFLYLPAISIWIFKPFLSHPAYNQIVFFITLLLFILITSPSHCSLLFFNLCDKINPNIQVRQFNCLHCLNTTSMIRSYILLKILLCNVQNVLLNPSLICLLIYFFGFPTNFII